MRLSTKVSANGESDQHKQLHSLISLSWPSKYSKNFWKYMKREKETHVSFFQTRRLVGVGLFCTKMSTDLFSRDELNCHSHYMYMYKVTGCDDNGEPLRW